MIPAYSVLADYYDRLTDNVPYAALADYYERLFEKYGSLPKFLLDLACGTGSLAKIFADRGYEVLGVDKSEAMLSYAFEKTAGMEKPPVFVAQSIQKLDLYGDADACISNLDSINHITSKAALEKGLSRLYNFIAPGGLFIFDINTEARFIGHSGEIFVREEQDFYCLWQSKYSPKSRLCRYNIDIFEGPDPNGAYYLRREAYNERFYSEKELRDMLETAGFKVRAVLGDMRLSRPNDRDERIFFITERN